MLIKKPVIAEGSFWLGLVLPHGSSCHWGLLSPHHHKELTRGGGVNTESKRKQSNNIRNILDDLLEIVSIFKDKGYYLTKILQSEAKRKINL